MEDIWNDAKDALSWFLVIGIICLIVYGISQYGDHVETINGHEYIRHIGYRTDDIEHSPDCWCQH